MFIDNPFGFGICPLALVDDTLVGQSVAVAIPFIDGTAHYRTFRIQNVMVDTQYQGQGIFTRLLIENTRLADTNGIPFIYTFPNENSLPTFLRKAGYSLLDRIPTLNLSARHLDDSPATDMSFKVSGPNYFTDEDVRLMSRFTELVRFRTNRTLEYLRWRFDKRSDRTYIVVRGFSTTKELHSIAVGKYYEPAQSVDVMEVACAANPIQMKATLQALGAAVGRHRIESYNVWMFGANPLAEIARAIGFVPTGQLTNLVWRWNPKNKTSIPSADEIMLTMGDSDVY